MVDSQADIREAHSRDVLTESHFLPAFCISLDRRAKRATDDFNRFQVHHIGHFPSGFGDVAFDCVGERVHACWSGEFCWHWHHHVGVNESDERNVVNINADEFALCLNIGDNIVDCDFCRRSRSCGNCENRKAGVFSRRNSFKASHIGKFGVRHDDSDSLCRVHWRAAANRNDVIRASLFASRNSSRHIFDRRIWFDFWINFVSKPRLVQNIGDFLCNAELNQIWISADESLFPAVRLRLVHDFVDCTFSVVRCLIKCDSVCHFLLYLQKAKFLL